MVSWRPWRAIVYCLVALQETHMQKMDHEDQKYLVNRLEASPRLVPAHAHR